MNRTLVRNRIHYFIYYYFLLAIAITLPYSIQLNSISIFILFINWLFERNYNVKWQKIKTASFVHLHLIFYFLHVLGLLYTDNLTDGTFDLEVKATIFLLPIIVYSSPELAANNIKNIFKAFVASCFFATIICLIYATYRNYTEGYTLNYLLRSMFIDQVDAATHTYFNYWYFSYNLFSSAINIHPIYLAMYVGFCCLIIFYLYVDNTKKNKIVFYSSIVLIGYFLIIILMLSARMQILIMLTLIIGTVIYYSLQKKLIVEGILIILGFIILFSGIIYLNPLNRERFTEMFDLQSNYNINNWGGRSLRLYKWKYTMEIVADHFLIGVGTGDTQDELQKKYYSTNFDIGYQNRFNTHNQYLQTILGLGIIGFLSFVFLFWKSMKLALLQQNKLFLSFTLLFYFSCLTESMLCTQKGVVYYAFFVSLLSISSNSLLYRHNEKLIKD